MDAMLAEVEALKRRVAALEAGSTLAAPYRVVDATGRVLLELDTDETGARLRLFNLAGTPGVTLLAAPDGGCCQVLSRGAASQPVAQLCADPHGGSLRIGSRAGQIATQLYADENGGVLAICDDAGETKVYAGIDPEHRGGGLVLWDRRGEVGVGLPDPSWSEIVSQLPGMLRRLSRRETWMLALLALVSLIPISLFVLGWVTRFAR